jgi:predicted transposase YdaD
LVMILPEAVERKFWQELQVFEEERKVTYVSNAERFGFERGIKHGIEQGIEQGMAQEARSLILRQLTRRIGAIAPNIASQIAMLSVSQLESLGEALLDFSSAADLGEWLRSHPYTTG